MDNAKELRQNHNLQSYSMLLKQLCDRFKVAEVLRHDLAPVDANPELLVEGRNEQNDVE